MTEDIKQFILSNINKSEITLEKLVEYDLNGSISFQEMKDAGLARKMQEAFIEKRDEVKATTKRIEDEKHRLHLAAIEKETFLTKLRSDAQEVYWQIKEKIDSKVVTKSEVSKIIGIEELDEILKPSSKIISVNFEDWKDLPPLLPDRTDIYVLGTIGSGKSCMLAGLFYQGKNRFVIDEDNKNLAGTHYRNQLKKAVRYNKLPPATNKAYLNYISIGLKDQDDEIHPINIIEMGGEKFNSTAESGKVDNESGIGANEYLTNNNKKVIFFVIDYEFAKKATANEEDQADQIEIVLTKLVQGKILAKTDAGILVVSKIDKMPKSELGNGSYEDLLTATRRYVDEEHSSLIENIRTFGKNHKFKTLITPFTLGEFKFNNSYAYNEETSEELFQLLVESTRKASKQPLLKRIFG
jgi:hypothetical protein